MELTAVRWRKLGSLANLAQKSSAELPPLSPSQVWRSVPKPTAFAASFFFQRIIRNHPHDSNAHSLTSQIFTMIFSLDVKALCMLKVLYPRSVQSVQRRISHLYHFHVTTLHGKAYLRYNIGSYHDCAAWRQQRRQHLTITL